MSKHEHDAHELNEKQEFFKGVVEDIVRVGLALGLHEGEISAIFGSCAGDFAACEDDNFAHDPERVALMKAEMDKRGRKHTYSPVKDTYLANFDYAYDEHMEKHKKLRDAKKNATDMLNKVCESHRKEGQ